MKGSKIMRKFIAALSATFIIAGCAAGCNPSSSSDSSGSSGGDSSYEEPVSETYTVVFDSDGGYGSRFGHGKRRRKTARTENACKGKHTGDLFVCRLVSRRQRMAFR